VDLTRQHRANDPHGELEAVTEVQRTKIWVGVTDEDWFTRLSQLRPDEVNLWQPSGPRAFRALQSGELFLFKLHSPRNVICWRWALCQLLRASGFARMGRVRRKEWCCVT